MEEGRSAFKILTGKPTRRKSLGRDRRRWEDYIRMDFKEVGVNTSHWVDSALGIDYWSSCACGIEPTGSISHIVN